MNRKISIAALICLLMTACSKSSDDSSTTTAADATVPTAVTPAVAVGHESTNLPSSHLETETMPIPPGANFEGLPRVGDIALGQSVWIHPWTIWVTGDQDYFLNGYHPYANAPEDDSWVRVVKESDGWVVYLEKSKFKWTPIDIQNTEPGRYDTQVIKKFVSP